MILADITTSITNFVTSLYVHTGLVGILHAFKLGIDPLVSFFGNIGLMTSFLYALIHTFLGIKSLHHGLSPEK